MHSRTTCCLALLVALLCVAGEEVKKPLDYTIKVETVMKHDDGKFLWYHPRVAALPGLGRDGRPRMVMTIQKHLHADDHYSGLSVLQTDDLGKSWTKPDPRP